MIIGAASPSPEPARGAAWYRDQLAIPADAALRTGREGSAVPSPGSGALPIKQAKVKLPEGPGKLGLKNHQKAYLSMLAEEAWLVARACYSHDDLTLDAWRQRESILASGVRISEAEQRHYKDIESHFLLLKGDKKGAFDAQMRKSGEALRIADHHLNQELKKHGLEREYAKAIAVRKFKGQPLDHLTARQLWVIVYDLRRTFTGKAQAKRAAKKAAKPNDDETNPF